MKNINRKIETSINTVEAAVKPLMSVNIESLGISLYDDELIAQSFSSDEWQEFAEEIRTIREAQASLTSVWRRLCSTRFKVQEKLIEDAELVA